MNIFKRAVSYIAYFISIINFITWFYLYFPIRSFLILGYWGESTFVPAAKKSYIVAPKLESIGFNPELAVNLNYIITYIHLLLVLLIFLVFLYKLLVKLFSWYRMLIHSDEVVDSDKKNSNKIFVLSLILILFNLLVNKL